jgi:hypothetical protein
MQNTPKNAADEPEEMTLAESEYYYDDAHGYEDFDEDEDDPDEQDEGADLSGGAFDVDLD